MLFHLCILPFSVLVHEGYGDDHDKTLGAFPFSQPLPKDKDEDAVLRQQLSGMGKGSLGLYYFFTKQKIRSQVKIEAFTGNNLGDVEMMEFIFEWVRKPLEKRKMLVTSILSFSHNVFKGLLL